MKMTVIKQAQISIIAAFCAVFCISQNVVAQDCDPFVPTFFADLSAQPDMTYISPAVIRDGNCCGTTAPDNCIAFDILLHEDAVGINFDICDGAVPPGALFYQIDCGPPVQVGEVICLDGPGPHHLTFCKPGNNQNVYCIESIPPPSASDTQIASEGCDAEVWCQGYDVITINWTSVYPGPVGTYDDYIACTTCETTTISAPADFPPYADFMICGETIAGCAVTPSCDTVRVYFEASLEVAVVPEVPVICYGAQGTEVLALGMGGFPPYTFTWSNGDVGETAWIEAPGTYSVTISDTSDCPPASFEFTVIEYTLPLTVDAGEDQLICSGSTQIQLSGTYSGIDSAMWVGGDGTFLPNRYDPNAIYIPTANEINSGQLELTLTLNPLGDCEPASDSIIITFATFEATVDSDVEDVLCFGANTGSMSISVTGNWPPYTIEWNAPGLSGWDLDGLEAGTYTATIENAAGCGQEFTFEIDQPTDLAPEIMASAPVSCFGENDGTLTIGATGGTTPYTFYWPSGPSGNNVANDLGPGEYTIIVEDQNGCQDSVTATIEEPLAIEITASANELVCPGENFTLSALATGGTGNITYHWNQGLTNLAQHTISIQQDTEFTVYATDANGCSTNTITLFVEVINMYQDSLTVSAGPGVCAGGQTTVVANYNGDHPPYTYTWQPALPNGPGPHTVSPGSTTTYTVTVSDACNNQVSDIVVVEIYPSFEAEVASLNDVQCNGMANGSAVVSISGGTPPFSFDWSDGQNHGNTPNGLGPGTYSVNITDANGCTDDASFEINQPSPISFDAGDGTVACPGDEVTIWAQASGGAGNFTYHWTPNLPNSPSHTIYPTNTVTYAVYATDANGCATPTVAFDIEVMQLYQESLVVNNPGGICPGSSTGLIASYDGDYPPYTFTWSQPGLVGPGPHTVSPSNTTTYNVTVTDICGQTLTDAITVEVYPVPVVNLPNVMGAGCTPVSVSYMGTQNDPLTHDYTWTVNGEDVYEGPMLSLNFNEGGTHTVSLTVTNTYGCSATSDDDALIIAIQSPEANFMADPWETGINNPEVQFTDLSSSDVLFWNWNFDDGEETSVQHPFHIYGDTGTYAVQLIVENSSGCRDTVIKNIEISPDYNIVIPNAFTPIPGANGTYDPSSTNNNIFYPFADYVRDFRMSIYNRWGELIFESIDQRIGWNGDYRGEPCPQDVYVYKIEFKFSDGVEITRVGDITLFR